MEITKIDLYEYFGLKKPQGAAGILTAYIHAVSNEINLKRKRPAMLVNGGGAYSFVSFREMEPVAIEFLSKGYNAFTLDYSVKPVTFPAQLIEGCMAVAYIRENADKLGVIPDKIAAVGFSAGGHFTAMLATLYDRKEVISLLGERAKLSKPDAVILSYPVITSGEKAHVGSIINISGGDESLYPILSLENAVNENSVPAFIWTTVNDACVPSENALYMALAYKKAGVPFELHMFEKGEHGISLATKETDVARDPKKNGSSIKKWTELADSWLKDRGFAIQD